jgi:urea transport system permease protein
VAIGGRATLFGPVLGAIAVAWAQTALSESFPSIWSYFQGALFVLVIAFLPAGLSSVTFLQRSLPRRLRLAARARPSPPLSNAGSLLPPEPDLSGVSAGTETGR